MDGKSMAYARIKRNAAKRAAKGQRSQQWKTIVASGLIGLFGAVIGSGATIVTTRQQLASQERVAATERAHQDELTRIARVDALNNSYYEAARTFQAASFEVAYYPVSEGTIINPEPVRLPPQLMTALKKGAHQMEARYTLLSPVGSDLVMKAANAVHDDQEAMFQRFRDDPSPAFYGLPPSTTIDEDFAKLARDISNLLKAIRADTKANRPE